MFKKILYTTAILAFALQSCKKEMIQRGDQLQGDNSQMKQLNYNYNDYPSVVNGMLVFRDDAHYDNYLSFLDSLISNLNPNDTIQDEHSILQSVESTIGFTSLRNTTHAAFMNQNETGWQTLQSIPDEHFIQGPDIRSVLNNNLEVRIGNELLFYLNKDIAVRVDASKTALITQFKNQGSNATLTSVLAIDRYRQFSTVIQLTGEGGIWRRITQVPLGSYTIFSSGVSYFDPCLNPYVVRFRGLMVSWNAEPGLEGYFMVNFGDGSPGQRVNTVPELGGNGTPSFTHAFPNSGTYNVTVNAYTVSGTFLASKVFSVLAVGGCTQNEKNSWWRYLTITGTPNRAVSGRVYLEHYGSSNHKMRMIAETRSMQQKSDGSWKLVKGKIEVEAKCSRRNSDCNVVELLQVHALKNNSKDMLKHTSKGERFFWNTAESKHYLTIGGIRYELPITINSCP